MFKRGISPIIATVLLIVLTLVAISILAVFVVPFVRESLAESKSCVNVIDKIRFDDGSRWNCKVSDPGNPSGERSGFSVTILSEEIVGFKAILFSSGSSDSYDITDGAELDHLRQIGRDFRGAVEVPERGGTRTYVADSALDRIEINPIMADGGVCKVQERLTLEECTDDDVRTSLLEH